VNPIPSLNELSAVASTDSPAEEKTSISKGAAGAEAATEAGADTTQGDPVDTHRPGEANQISTANKQQPAAADANDIYRLGNPRAAGPDAEQQPAAAAGAGEKNTLALDQLPARVLAALQEAGLDTTAATIDLDNIDLAWVGMIQEAIQEQTLAAGRHPAARGSANMIDENATDMDHLEV